MFAMQAFRQLRHLTRFVLVWFALSLGVAMASSLVAPKATELVCTSGGMLKLVTLDGTDSAAPSHGQLDCALCLPMALPPAPCAVPLVQVSPLSHALQPVAAAHIASATAPPLPSRGPPAL
jgi:hypothetical protein